MVEEAHGEVKLALQELRDLARGIHPAVLTDRGLDAALSSVASRCTVPVKVTVDLPSGRPRPSRASPTSPSPSCCRTSASTAAATPAAVDVWRAEDRLMLQVTDDGRGGADPGRRQSAWPACRTAGRRRRPPRRRTRPGGGPTTVTAELPWRERTRGARRTAHAGGRAHPSDDGPLRGTRPAREDRTDGRTSAAAALAPRSLLAPFRAAPARGPVRAAEPADGHHRLPASRSPAWPSRCRPADHLRGLPLLGVAAGLLRHGAAWSGPRARLLLRPRGRRAGAAAARQRPGRRTCRTPRWPGWGRCCAATSPGARRLRAAARCRGPCSPSASCACCGPAAWAC